jgi:hypothetical protein
VRERELGENYAVAASLGEVALALSDMGKHDDAMADARRGVEMAQKTLGNEHPSTGDALVRQAEVLLAAGRPREASSAYQSALAILERAFPPSHPRVERARQGLTRSESGPVSPPRAAR